MQSRCFNVELSGHSGMARMDAKPYVAKPLDMQVAYKIAPVWDVP